MDGVFNCELSAIVNGFQSNSSVASSSTSGPSATTTFVSITNTPTISINNHQMLDDVDYWEVRAMDNDYHLPTFDALANTNTITTTPSMPINDDTIIDDDLGLHEVINSFYQRPNMVTSQTSFGDVDIPINYNVQTIDDDDDDDLHLLHTKSPPFFAATTTPVPIITNPPPAPAAIIHHQQNSSNFQKREVMLNLNQPMNETNIRRLLQDSNYPIIDLSNPQPAADHNQPLFSIPCLPSTQHPPQNHLSAGVSKWTDMFAQSSSSNSDDKRNREKRVYKMPLQGHNSDPWSWIQYREKHVYASKRIYYKCATRNDCKAVRRVEQNGESVIMKYTDHHNHLPPMTTTTDEHVVVGTNNNDYDWIVKEDCIFEGFENLFDL